MKVNDLVEDLFSKKHEPKLHTREITEDERNLIKKYFPNSNVFLKSGKDYLFPKNAHAVYGLGHISFYTEDDKLAANVGLHSSESDASNPRKSPLTHFTKFLNSEQDFKDLQKELSVNESVLNISGESILKEAARLNEGKVIDTLKSTIAKIGKWLMSPDISEKHLKQIEDLVKVEAEIKKVQLKKMYANIAAELSDAQLRKALKIDGSSQPMRAAVKLEYEKRFGSTKKEKKYAVDEYAWYRFDGKAGEGVIKEITPNGYLIGKTIVPGKYILSSMIGRPSDFSSSNPLSTSEVAFKEIKRYKSL